MSRPSADDRCPGALRLHEAADGFLARVRIPGGRVSPAQLRALAALAAELGDGHLSLTSRGNVQLRGLGSACGQELADGLYAAGLLPSLTHDRVRNVVASPLGALTGHPATEEVLREFDEALLEDDSLVELSGRFLFGIDNGTGDVLAMRPDVAVALEDRDVARLAIGGSLTAVTAPVDLAADLLIGAAHRFLALRESHGALTAWRVSELPAEALAELGPGRPGPSLARPAADDRSGAPLAIAKAAPGHSPGTAPALGAQGEAIVAGVPLGNAPAAAWQEIADLFPAERADDVSAIRLTPWRSVVLVEPSPEAATLLAEHGFLLDDADPLALVTACVGRPGCGKALADVRSDAPALAAAHPGVRLHVSGCDRRCGHPTGTHLSAIADGTNGYTLEQH